MKQTTAASGFGHMRSILVLSVIGFLTIDGSAVLAQKIVDPQAGIDSLAKIQGINPDFIASLRKQTEALASGDLDAINQAASATHYADGSYIPMFGPSKGIRPYASPTNIGRTGSPESAGTVPVTGSPPGQSSASGIEGSWMGGRWTVTRQPDGSLRIKGKLYSDTLFDQPFTDVGGGVFRFTINFKPPIEVVGKDTDGQVLAYDAVTDLKVVGGTLKGSVKMHTSQGESLSSEVIPR